MRRRQIACWISSHPDVNYETKSHLFLKQHQLIHPVTEGNWAVTKIKLMLSQYTKRPRGIREVDMVESQTLPNDEPCIIVYRPEGCPGVRAANMRYLAPCLYRHSVFWGLVSISIRCPKHTRSATWFHMAFSLILFQFQYISKFSVKEILSSKSMPFVDGNVEHTTGYTTVG